MLRSCATSCAACSNTFAATRRRSHALSIHASQFGALQAVVSSRGAHNRLAVLEVLEADPLVSVQFDVC